MTEPERPTPPPLPPPLPTSAAADVHRRAPRRPMFPLPNIMLYIMLPAAAAFCVQSALLDLFSQMVGSALALGAFWIGYSRLNRGIVTAILVGCCLLALKNFPLHNVISIPLLAASAAAGALGATLAARNADEDDFFFIPLLLVLGVMLLAITLGAGGGWPKTFERTRVYFAEISVNLKKSLESTGKETPEWVVSMPFLLTLHVILWGLGLWLAGRLARRVTGHLGGLKSSLIMFRIQHRYIFLLILGLILEIFSSLATRETFAYLAWPILGLVALAGFLDGLGILLFLAAIRRMAGRTQEAFWLTVMGVITAFMLGQFTALVGLADVWFDFRKLERLRRQLNAGPQDHND